MDINKEGSLQTVTHDPAPSVTPDLAPALQECIETVAQLHVKEDKQSREVEGLREENASLRTSSTAFGALAERLNQSLHKDRSNA